MSGKIRVVHYLNQFFAGLGGEAQASLAPRRLAGNRGPGRLLEQLGPDLEVVATVTAGDNYVAEHLEAAVAEIVALVREVPADVLVAGPAFNAGRYGLACAAVCCAVAERLGLPAVTAMSPENPAVESYRRDVTIVRTGNDVLGMRDALVALAAVARKRARGERVDAAGDGTLPRGVRENYVAERTGAQRAIDLLLAKMAGEPFLSEYPMPVFDRVAPAPPVPDLARATVALVTSGGIVPRGNPDRIESASASRFGEYSIAGLDRLDAATHQSVHGGYDPTYANEDPNRVLPLDALRELEREGRIGKLHDTYFATVGNSTSVRTAVRFGEEIAALLVNVGVQAVILTST